MIIATLPTLDDEDLIVGVLFKNAVAAGLDKALIVRSGCSDPRICPDDDEVDSSCTVPTSRTRLWRVDDVEAMGHLRRRAELCLGPALKTIGEPSESERAFRPGARGAQRLNNDVNFLSHARETEGFDDRSAYRTVDYGMVREALARHSQRGLIVP